MTGHQLGSSDPSSNREEEPCDADDRHPFSVAPPGPVDDHGPAAIVGAATHGIGEAKGLRAIDTAVGASVRALAAAGQKPSDLDVVELYDTFTIDPILFLEDLGFCPKGEGGRFVSDGRIRPGGLCR